MTSKPPDGMGGSSARSYRGAGANEFGGGRALYGSEPSSGQNPYAVSGPGSGTTAGNAAKQPDGAPSRWTGASTGEQHGHGQTGHGRSEHSSVPPDAAAHYVPGSPAAAHIGADGSKRPGLRALAVLLVLGSLAYVAWHVATWGPSLLTSVETCGDTRGLPCFTGEPFRTWLFAPIGAVILAWGFASGAAVEARQGRARGYLHLLAGIAALVVGGMVSAL